MPLVFENQESNKSIQNPKLEIKNRPSDQNLRLATSVQNAKSATRVQMQNRPLMSKIQPFSVATNRTKVQSASSHHTFLDYKKCPRDKK